MLSQEIILERMPLYWRMTSKDDSEENCVKSNLDFQFIFDDELGLVRQRLSDELKEMLHTIYQQEYNVGYLQEVNTLAAGYATDLYDFITRSIGRDDRVRNILEIGCGGCLILGWLKRDGFDVTGIDPSPFATKEGGKRGIPIIEDFFPYAGDATLYDLIMHADVLEHSYSPVPFLEEQYKKLNDGGLLIVSVPDNTENIRRGDVSMALHQHVNYFCTQSLEYVLTRAGFKVLEVVPAQYGGSLYGLAVKSEEPQQAARHANDIRGFFERSNRNLEHFEAWYRGNTGKTMAFYCPLRAMPYLTRVTGPFRLLDDTPHWHGKQFDGLDGVVENMGDLLKAPSDVVFIFSLTFGDVIKEKLLTKGFTGEIVLLGDFLDKA